MHVISFVSLKGGTSKSTLCRNVAVAASMAGHTVTILDFDQQATLRGWGMERKRAPEVIGETSTNRKYVEATLDKLRSRGTDICFIDTPGSFEGGYSANAIALADFVVIPCRPSGEDTDTFWTTEERVKGAGKRFGAVVSQAPTNTAKPAADLLRLFTESGVPVCPTPVHLRQAVPTSFAGGSSVFEIAPTSDSDTRAVAEMRAVWTWLAGEIGVGA